MTCLPNSYPQLFVLIVCLMISNAISLVLWAGVRPVSRSFMFSLSLRMFDPDQMPTPRVPVQRREQQNAARRRQSLEDPVKVQEKDRKKNDKRYHGDPDHRQQRIEASRRPHVIAQQLAYKQMEELRRLILRRPHIWKHITWRTHAPVLYD